MQTVVKYLRVIKMDNKFDILIVGAGPAGVSAALTACNRGKKTAVIANPPDSSKLYLAESVTNYPGITGSGSDIIKAMRSQLEQSDALIINGRALSVVPLGKTIGVAVGREFYEAGAVIVASGISRRPICPGETEFLGRGVSYCATCDGMLYKGKTVAVIGDSEEAAQDARFLRDIGCRVLPFTGREKLDIRGGMKADTLIADGTEHKVDCVFILKDTLTAESLVSGIEAERGIIKTDRSGKTNIKGVFAAGDCTGAPYQIAKAVGEGNIAVLSACEYINTISAKEI